MLGLTLLHYNEFKASFEQFVDIQKKNYFNSHNWTNLGTTFLSKVIFRSPSEKQDSLSQINSRSIYNSNRTNATAKKPEDDQICGSELKFLKGKKDKADVLLASIEQSSEFIDFVIEKDNQDQTKMAISCLKRYISSFIIFINLFFLF